jgi:carboxyl-terminal processing protease
VWHTVKETHYDSTLGGLDWQGIYKALRPRMESAMTSDEARSVIEEMLSHLNQSHFILIPGDYFQGESTDAKLMTVAGVCGFAVRLLHGRIIVASIRPESPAYAKGVRAGWEVVRIKDQPVEELIDREAKTFGGRSRFAFEVVSTVSSELAGPPGDSVSVLFCDGENRERELAITFMKRPGHCEPAVGSIPPSIIDFEARRLAGDIGYIRFNGFAQPVYLMQSFNAAMDSFLACRGVIIDLRGNSGGIGGIALGMAGWFVREKGRSLATLQSRERTRNVTVLPRGNAYGGPLAVLIDECAVSAAEFLAGGLQDIGRARLFGDRTAGFSGQGDLLKLPNGDVFIHTISRHLRADGTDVEGSGIKPDVEARPTRESLLTGKDAALDTAAAWLRGGGR